MDSKNIFIANRWVAAASGDTQLAFARLAGCGGACSDNALSRTIQVSYTPRAPSTSMQLPLIIAAWSEAR
jgi:hypothetical protein